MYIVYNYEYKVYVFSLWLIFTNNLNKRFDEKKSIMFSFLIYLKIIIGEQYLFPRK